MKQADYPLGIKCRLFRYGAAEPIQAIAPTAVFVLPLLLRDISTQEQLGESPLDRAA